MKPHFSLIFAILDNLLTHRSRQRRGVPGPYFAHLATLAREVGAKVLSMGMSADFETAIAMGATHVRVGSALFGKRG